MKTEKLRTILLDDERFSLETLQWLLEEYCPFVKIVGTFSNPDEAMRVLHQTPPDLLFVDIAMPGINGLDLVYQLFPLTYPVIFVTAHNGAIVKALKQADILFLLKPVDDKELCEVINQAVQMHKLLSPNQINSIRLAFQNGR